MISAKWLPPTIIEMISSQTNPHKHRLEYPQKKLPKIKIKPDMVVHN
jgi:hypothetical protein